MSRATLQIASDLHLEFYQDDFPPHSVYQPDIDRDVLVLAGDIGVGLGALDFVLSELAISPVVYIPGNHEYYTRTARREIDASWHEIGHSNTSFFYLVAESVNIDGLRFWGAPWYSDLWGKTDPWLHFGIQRGVADFNPYQKEPWTVRNHLDSHIKQTRVLLDHRQPIDVVVTHWPPTKQAIHPKYANDELNPYFINDRENVVRAVSPKVWISGHIHESYDYWVGETRCVGNPSGYPNEDQLSPHFCPIRTVDVSY